MFAFVIDHFSSLDNDGEPWQVRGFQPSALSDFDLCFRKRFGPAVISLFLKAWARVRLASETDTKRVIHTALLMSCAFAGIVAVVTLNDFLKSICLVSIVTYHTPTFVEG